MINKKFVEKLKKEHAENENQRRQIISLSNMVLYDSKRIIFSLHRGERKKVEAQFKEIEEILKKLEKKFGAAKLNEEGCYKAGAEEYVEAKTLFFVLSGQKVDTIKGVNLPYDSYLGGICDLTGELVRYAINCAAKGDFETAGKVKVIVNDIMTELVEFDMTGYLRTKYDQAKSNLRKIEQVIYEIKIRK